VIEAKDFRRRGWVMASQAGHRVRSVTELHAADILELSFADGNATATITDITREEQP
jgi:exonuclease VII large subunit